MNIFTVYFYCLSRRSAGSICNFSALHSPSWSWSVRKVIRHTTGVECVRGGKSSPDRRQSKIFEQLLTCFWYYVSYIHQNS